MGMSIDKAISHLDTYSSTMGSGQTTQAQHEEAKKVAIATMRKFQKIEEIVKQYKKFGNIDFSMQIISGVIEDGNDD